MYSANGTAQIHVWITSVYSNFLHRNAVEIWFFCPALIAIFGNTPRCAQRCLHFIYQYSTNL